MQNRVILRVEKNRVLLKQCPLVFVPHCTRCPLQSISHLFTRKLPSFTPIQMRISAAPFGKFGQFQASSAQNLVPQRSSKNGLNSFLETSWHSSFGKSHEETGPFLVNMLLPKKYSPIVAPPPLSLPGKCADQLGCSPRPAADVPSKQLATLLKVRQISTHCLIH